ncbi:MAG: hypothetical protein Fur0042_20730 [Cyanophyceae cyanobacterium]
MQTRPDFSQPHDDRDPIVHLAQLDDRYNRIILLGQDRWIDQLVKTLHLHNIGDAALWSPPITIAPPDQMVRILARPRLVG